MRSMPDMTVLAPADAVECEAAIRWPTNYRGPVYLRLARDFCPDIFDSDYQFAPGKTYTLKEGRDVLVISTGPQTARCLEAAQSLDAQGISVGVLHLPSIKPLNIKEVVQACEPFNLVMTVEEHNIQGGLGALIAEILAEHSPRRIIRVGIPDRWGESAPNEFLLDLFGLSPSRLSERLKHIRDEVGFAG